MELHFKYKFLGEWRTTANLNSKCCTMINLIMLDVFNNNFHKSEIINITYNDWNKCEFLIIKNPIVKIVLPI